MVQVPDANDAFVKLMVPVPAVAVTVPPQPLTTFGAFATTRLAGRLSVKLALMATTFTLLSIENVIVLGVFVATVAGLKLLVIAGGCRMMIPTSAVPPLEAARPAACG